MARNKFDVDEKLESPFQWKHLKRAWKYISKHKYKMLAALGMSALASIATLFIPKITQWVLDEAVPNGDTAMIGRMALMFVGIRVNSTESRTAVPIVPPIMSITFQSTA